MTDKPIQISESYGSNTYISMKVTVTGKSSITQFLKLLSQSEMTDYEQVKDLKNKWIKSIGLETSKVDLTIELKKILKEILPNTEFTSFYLSERADSWTNKSTWYFAPSYFIKNDGNDLSEFTIRQKIAEDGRLKELGIMELHLYPNYSGGSNNDELQIQPIDFDGHKFKKIPFIIVAERKYGDDQYVFAKNEELGIFLEKDEHFYINLMNKLVELLTNDMGEKSKILREKYLIT